MSQSPVVITATAVGKRFSTHHRKATSLKERVIRREQGAREDFWALRGIDLTVHQGQTVGLVGPNGSGKSTLLKVLSGILRPTNGTVAVSGRVASLLELGAGFDGELTGRDNIFLNASLLGLSRRETEAIFDDIVEFSGLGEFVDNPVKHYSSGMYVRLGFSVAVHVNPDILIIDEVLAVGDEAFQRKCIDRIEDFQTHGKTILFVSHSASLVEQLCSRAVVLEHGVVSFDGEPELASEHLRDILGVDRVQRSRKVLGATVEEVVPVHAGTGEVTWTAMPGDPLRVEVLLTVTGERPVGELSVRVAFITDEEDSPAALIEVGAGVVGNAAGKRRLCLDVEHLPELAGGYTLLAQVVEHSDGTVLATARSAEPLRIQPDPAGRPIAVMAGVRVEDV